MSGTRKPKTIVYARYPPEYRHPLLDLDWYYSHQTMSIAMKCGRCDKKKSLSYVTKTKNLRLDAFCFLCGWCPASDGLDDIPQSKD